MRKKVTCNQLLFNHIISILRPQAIVNNLSNQEPTMKKLLSLITAILAISLITMLASGCGQQPDQPEQNDQIRVDLPLPEMEVFGTFTVAGSARGSWFFEGQFPAQVIDEKGDNIAMVTAIAQGDWMTNDFVQFRAEFNFEVTKEQDATLILKKDNPSGLPENDAKVEIAIKLKKPETPIKPETMDLKVFFGSSSVNNNQDICDKVFAVTRTVPKTEAVARAALTELLKGPTEEDKALTFTTMINPGVKIQSLTIENGTAKVDFDKTLEDKVGGSCRVGIILKQITETLKQFPTVKDVVISIDGRTEDILQP